MWRLLVHNLHVDAVGTISKYYLIDVLLQKRLATRQERVPTGEDYPSMTVKKWMNNGWNNGCQQVHDGLHVDGFLPSCPRMCNSNG